MAQVEKKEVVGVGGHLLQAAREGSIFVFVALAAYLLLALMSYSPADNHSPHPQNVGGIAGVWFSTTVLYLFGYLAYLVPAMVAYAAFIIFRGRKIFGNKTVWVVLLIRFGGFFMTLAAGTALAKLHFSQLAQHPGFSIGGVLGDQIGLGLVGVFSFTGSTLFLVALFLTGVTLLTGMSWFATIDGVGKFTLALLGRIGNSMEHNVDVAKDRVEGARSKHQRTQKLKQDKKTKKAKPRIEPSIQQVDKSARVQRSKQRSLFKKPLINKELPPLSLLDPPISSGNAMSDEVLEAISRQVELKLKDFGIEVQVVAVQPGPVITRYELQPAPGVKVSQITNLAKDIARSLSVTSVRVVEIIAGKSVIGLEIPNEHREIVYLSEVLQSREYDRIDSPATMALGKDISGKSTVVDLVKMPHLLVAGTTGSGKSVALNAMILSILYKATAEQVRIIMVDPKMLELSVYEGIPHLLAPVVTDMKEAANALRWCVAEMERRYRLMAAMGVRNLSGFNRKVKEAAAKGQPIKDPLFVPTEQLESDAPELEALPLIVVVIDELADMMMIVGKKVEELIARLAQKARAAGIHLILATQRPSVDVITGLIKANIPTRIAFQVSSRIDSRTILDQMGAEQLLGHGDMLYLPPGQGMPKRVHGAFVADNEVHDVVKFLKQAGSPEYIDGILQSETSELLPAFLNDEGSAEDVDALYDEAVRFVTESRRASISSVQRKLKVGYNRAARMVEAMEIAGVVSPLQSNGTREVLAPPPVED